jgi:hypothetical protein
MDRRVAHREFQHTVEEEPPATRAAAVETEHELVEVLLKMVGLD